MIYLNNAATSWPKAEGLSGYMKEVFQNLPGHGNRATLTDHVAERTCRNYLAELLKVRDEACIVYASCATHALNMGLLGFPWRDGDIVLTTAAEHNAVLRPLYFLQKQGKLRYHVMPVDRSGRLTQDTLAQFLKEYRPRMVILTHGSNVTGAVNDAAGLTALAKEYGCTVFLDASQTVGLYPVEPEIWGIDMVALTGHKYLLGPQGTGALYVSGNTELTPVLTGGTGIRSDEDEMPDEMPIHLEAGTQNEQSLSGLAFSIGWAREHPMNLKRTLGYIRRLEKVLRVLGCHVAEVEDMRTPVLTFASNSLEAEDIGDMLAGGFDIICRTGLHCAPLIFPAIGMPKTGSVRFSLSRFTTEEEIAETEEALKAVLL
ncbi:aminotransferase class V-fold PLP-dependent enzyme [Ruminococcus sp. OA3]|uniref:aminotransferase class V-fold PLP-dependent enzyme n=1 Tax=Ruminococcus sp. OA3 TaxID=2914164 RepID=UPI001F06D820|nr:aminotransferase class V-fold PLP-dependent enzyme [Ruminococcus sp. OA3]MCH1982576.1 aminotransferase class V-fold PLP-dependent enzyme [Ruminococcus sp. OA3]